MSSFSVVLDACVLYPAALRDTLLRAADTGLYRLHWSEEILDEVRRNLIKNGVADEFRPLRPLDIDVQSPDEFLTHLYDLYPREITTLLKRQAAFCQRPPLTLGQILAALEKTVPRFVSQVEADLEDDPADEATQ